MALAQSEGKPEGAARFGLAFHPDFSAHQLRQPLADRQAQTRAAVLAGHRAVRLLESGEQPLLIQGGYADAGVLYFAAQQHAMRAFLQHADTQGDATLGGELDRVAGEVEHDLAQTQGIAHE